LGGGDSHSCGDDRAADREVRAGGAAERGVPAPVAAAGKVIPAGKREGIAMNIFKTLKGVLLGRMAQDSRVVPNTSSILLVNNNYKIQERARDRNVRVPRGQARVSNILFIIYNTYRLISELFLLFVLAGLLFGGVCVKFGNTKFGYCKTYSNRHYSEPSKIGDSDKHLLKADSDFHKFPPVFYSKKIIGGTGDRVNDSTPPKNVLTSAAESARLGITENRASVAHESLANFLYPTFTADSCRKYIEYRPKHLGASVESADFLLLNRHTEKTEATMTKSTRTESVQLTKAEDYKQITISLIVFSNLLDEAWQNGCLHGVMSCYNASKGGRA
jgi:hypothetical protein